MWLFVFSSFQTWSVHVFDCLWYCMFHCTHNVPWVAILCARYTSFSLHNIRMFAWPAGEATICIRLCTSVHQSSELECQCQCRSIHVIIIQIKCSQLLHNASGNNAGPFNHLLSPWHRICAITAAVAVIVNCSPSCHRHSERFALLLYHICQYYIIYRQTNNCWNE